MKIPKVGNGPIPKQVVGSSYDAVVGSGGDHYVQTVKNNHLFLHNKKHKHIGFFTSI
ncbi:hypothetical protein JCM15640A_23200 [Hoylesella timonensis 4401737 = DSM 22865 = JCM 15640]